MALRITKQGLEAIGVKDNAVGAATETSVSPAPSRTEVGAHLQSKSSPPVLPRTERVAVFYNKRDNHELEFKDADQAAQTLGIGLVHIPVGSPADFEPAFKRMIEEKCDALYIVASTFANAHWEKLEVWFQDEMRMGQKNKLTYRRARKGSRPRAAHDQRTQST